MAEESLVMVSNITSASEMMFMQTKHKINTDSWGELCQIASREFAKWLCAFACTLKLRESYIMVKQEVRIDLLIMVYNPSVNIPLKTSVEVLFRGK